ncbi:MAG: DUF2851 family protein [Bacteroidales bacterium]|nr:DUF2851 family protein [Bacteroidales bacterium]
MKEEFLHYLWKYRLFCQDKLIDNEGNLIEVLHPGLYNRDAGPDFFNTRLKIAGIEWAGNTEIHIRSSDFDSHGHNTDPAYDNVIIHFVAENDRKVFNSRGEELLTVAPGFDPLLYEKYVGLLNNPFIIACEHHIPDIDPLFIRNWIAALVAERLEHKTEQLRAIYSATGNDREETFYRVLTRYFGFRVNTEPFEMLAGALPFKIIRKHSDNIFQIEALLFGTAGLLDEGLFRDAVNDKYYLDLIREYKILSAKYSLKPVHGWLWKFSRLRPANFPTVRISQLAAMLSVSGGLFSRTLEAADLNGLRALFGVRASDYWDDHFVFGKKSTKTVKTTGSQACDLILINAVIPVLFFYGRSRGRYELQERALDLLEDLAPEKNAVIDDWIKSGLVADSAFTTQGLIQLRNEYCSRRRCLECRIGAMLIGEGAGLKKEDELMLEP